MTEQPENKHIVERVAGIIGGAAARMANGGVDRDTVAQGTWAAALQVGQDTVGLDGLIEWLRGTADELEDRLAAQMAERARRPN